MLVIERERDRDPLEVFSDTSITAKAKGVFGYLMSREEGQHITLPQVVESMKENDATIRGAVKELEKAGYLRRERGSDRGMTFYDWILQL